MQASVIIATYNRRGLVRKAVASLLNQDFPDNDYEIVVVVDGSQDGSVAALRGLCGGERLKVLEQENRGPSAARNLGMRAARGDLLIFVDDDMACGQGLIRAHVEAHANAERMVGMGGIYVAPEDRGRLAARYFEAGLGGAYLRVGEHPETAWPEDVWSFGNTSLERKALMRVGGFDEHFRMREDAELGVRLMAAGMRPKFVAGAVAHQRCVKSAAELVRDSEAFAEADVLFMRMHHGRAPQEFVRRLQMEEKWKRRVRSLAAANIALADVVLPAVYKLGERFGSVKMARELEIRALHLQCGLHWYRRAKELGLELGD